MSWLPEAAVRTVAGSMTMSQPAPAATDSPCCASLAIMVAMATDFRSLVVSSRWIAEAALAGASEAALVDGVCARLEELGFELKRVMFGIDTLHPVVRGRGFIWRRGTGVEPQEYGRADTQVD